MGWQYMVHPDIEGASTLVPDSPDVIHWHEARGWVCEATPAELLPDQPDTGLTIDEARAAEELEQALEEAQELKGEALDAALKERGLPTTGKADEKRARLAEAETTEGDKE